MNMSYDSPYYGEEHCPECGSSSLIVQDFDTLTNPVSMLKLIDRRQVRCTQCSWMNFEMPFEPETQPEEIASANR